MSAVGNAVLVRADATALPLADDTVDLIVTSPPFFALRSYTDGGEHYAGQLGAEATPTAYIDSLLVATAEMVRVLKPSGSLWINLGDKYAGGGQGGNVGGKLDGGDHLNRTPHNARTVPAGLRTKSLIGIPWRYALRCIDELGLILRAEVIWSKPNGLPESVTDRVRRCHEQWFHFTTQGKYYSAVDEIREPHAPPSGGRGAVVNGNRVTLPSGGRNAGISGVRPDPNPLGKLPGSVWTIATQPLKVPAELGIDHFAAFPMEWPRRIISGWSPQGVCTACGEGRRPVVQSKPFTPKGWAADQQIDDGRSWHGGDPSKRALGIPAADRVRTITGYTCACADIDAPTTPGVVLDPFGGTGTTALMAKVLGRVGISMDMSADYCRLAAWRTTDPKQMHRATNPPKGKPMNDPETERIRKRHPDIPQDPLPFDAPEVVAKIKPRRQKSAASVRFAKCPKCLADRPIGVIRGAGGNEVFRDHNKVIGKGRRIPCPGSGQTAPASRER